MDELFHCLLRWKPERAPQKNKKTKKQKNQKNKKTNETKQNKNKKGGGNLGENPKGRQGRFSQQTSTRRNSWWPGSFRLFLMFVILLPVSNSEANISKVLNMIFVGQICIFLYKYSFAKCIFINLLVSLDYLRSTACGCLHSFACSSLPDIGNHLAYIIDFYMTNFSCIILSPLDSNGW